MLKKGQAAMEFLMTYGWAILVVLIAIGALAYFGVLNPSRFLPSTCNLTPGLSCDDFKVISGAAGAGSVQLVIRNGAGDSIDFSQLYIDIDDSGAYVQASDCGNGATPLDPVVIADGAQSGTLTMTCGPAVTKDSKFKASIRGTYTKGTNPLAHNLAGALVAKAE